jgi:hypothetical protein
MFKLKKNPLKTADILHLLGFFLIYGPEGENKISQGFSVPDIYNMIYALS